jgi:hypothetical protein
MRGQKPSRRFYDLHEPRWLTRPEVPRDYLSRLGANPKEKLPFLPAGAPHHILNSLAVINAVGNTFDGSASGHQGIVIGPGTTR